MPVLVMKFKLNNRSIDTAIM